MDGSTFFLWFFVPTGLRSFLVKPNLPEVWDKAALRSLRAYGAEVDIELSRVGDRTRVSVYEGRPARLVAAKELSCGESMTVDTSEAIAKPRNCGRAGRSTLPFCAIR